MSTAAPRALGRIAGWFAARGQRGAEGLPVRAGGMEYRQSTATPASVLGFDQALLWVVVALLAWGLVMVYSASIAMPDNPRFGKISHTHFLVRHLMALAMGFVAALLAFQIPMLVWERQARALFIVVIALLGAVLVPHVGTEVNGARRWLSLGIMNFQPSELAKLAVVIYAADYMCRKMDVKERFFRAVLPMGAAVALVGGLLLAEPDMGAFMVIAVTAMGILFLGGVNARMFILITMVLVAAFGLMIAFNDYRRARLFSYLDPRSEHNTPAQGYQPTPPLIALGPGGIFGGGPGGSAGKRHRPPRARTDLPPAVIGAESGPGGVLVLIVLFFWMTRRIMHIGRQAIALDRVFSGLVAQGVAIWVGFQAFINMGVNLGALPTKGLTLPLMSFGGSAILMHLVALAIVLRVDYENKLLMRGGRA